MSLIIGHIVGIDEINKSRLTRQFSKNIAIIDLDRIQQFVYNNREIIKQKLSWAQLSNDIVALQKQKKNLESKKANTKNIIVNIKKTMARRNGIKKQIHTLWKTLMEKLINGGKNTAVMSILFIGYNIFPKDYRVKIDLQLPETALTCIYQTDYSEYSNNQIQYYLDKYRDKIIKGTFPLNLLDGSYITKKYAKVCEFYDRLGYQYLDTNTLIKRIKKNRIPAAKPTYYLATLYKSTNIIPVNYRTPIELFLTKKEAIDAVSRSIKRPTNRQIYLYHINTTDIQKKSGRLYTKKSVIPHKEKLIILSPS